MERADRATREFRYENDADEVWDSRIRFGVVALNLIE
jgi:hypothetical protein